jgi:transforming growth factor-beta-induced protein
MSLTNRKFLSGLILGVLTIVCVTYVGINPVASDDRMESNDSTIVEVATSNPQFSTLVKALNTADLVETLNTEGPFTVFAPTNQAFEQLPEGKLETLLEEENREKLTNLLKYHVIPGRISSGDVMGIDGVHGAGGSMVKTLSGDALNINVVGETIKVNRATVVKPNIEASNGIIHVIDGVLSPTSKPASMSGGQAMGMIKGAIEKGVPMYNNGHHGRTAELYMKTSMRILNSSADDLPEEAIDALKHSTGLARRMHDDSERAWVLRYGMDAALRTMTERMEREM